MNSRNEGRSLSDSFHPLPWREGIKGRGKHADFRYLEGVDKDELVKSPAE
jgi:hypothetical protein